MTKKKDEVNADNPATETAAPAAASGEESTDTAAGEPDVNPDEGDGSEEAEALEDAGFGQAASDDQVEQVLEEAEEPPVLNTEAKQALEAEYPVLRNHGSQNAAVTGLQTSPGYDPSKLRQ